MYLTSVFLASALALPHLAIAGDQWEGTRIGDEVVVVPLGGKASSDAACGIYALLAAAHRAGRTDLRLADLLKPDYLSGAKGSTLSDLKPGPLTSTSRVEVWCDCRAPTSGRLRTPFSFTCDRGRGSTGMTIGCAS